MSRDEDHTRRWLINAGGHFVDRPSGRRICTNRGAAPPRAIRDPAEDPATDSTLSPRHDRAADYVADAHREPPAAVVARTNLRADKPRWCPAHGSSPANLPPDMWTAWAAGPRRWSSAPTS